MGRFASGTTLLCGLLGCILLSSCGSSSVTKVSKNQIPAAITLTPSSDTSLELGATEGFSATATNSGGAPLTETFAFQSSNPAVLTIAHDGAACAGTWDSLTAPSVCTPGATGVVQVTAEAGGVSSPPANVYVHQHVTKITISQVPGQPPTLSPICFSKDAPLLGPGPEKVTYQAFAYSNGTDVTSTVGLFSWLTVPIAGQQITSSSVSLIPLPFNSPQCLKGTQGQCLNQQTAAASVPGTSQFFASAGGVNSQPVSFTTCPVQSIAVTPANGSTSTSFTVSSGTSTTLNATVKDILGMNLTGVPLTWSTSYPPAVTASGTPSGQFASVGSVGSPAAGGGSVTVSCTPPTCNGGIIPSAPIYLPHAFDFTVKPSASSSGSTPPTVFVTTTACGTSQSCGTRIVPLTRSGTNPFAPGSSLGFPSTPNSVKFDPTGSTAYFGIDSSTFGTQGLMVLNGTSVSQVPGIAGKVLAVSPDATTVILSDTVDSPSRLIVCTGCAAATRSISTFLFPNAVAAAFSPDSLKAYIVSSSPCPGTGSAGCLMIFSKMDAPQFIQLAAPATDVAFLGEGAFGYLGGVSTASFLATCDHLASTTFPPGQIFSFASPILRPLPDGQSLIALAPPDIQTLTATVNGSGCVSPSGSLAVTNTLGSPINLGAGNFTPKQFLLSPDGSTAYILAQIQLPINLAISGSICEPNVSSTGCATTTYTYTMNGAPSPNVGMTISVAGMPAGDNGTFPIIGVSGPSSTGTNSFLGTFTVANASGVTTSTPQNGTGSGTATLQFDFVIAFNLQTQTRTDISLAGSALPLSASLSPTGDFLFVGADDGQVHVIDTATALDSQQVALPFPQSSLCLGPGNPPISLQSLLNVTSATQDNAGNTTFAYTLTSGPPIAVGNPVKVTGMTDPANNGTFIVASSGAGAFTAVNPTGVTATSQAGTGSAGLACNPDLVIVKP